MFNKWLKPYLPRSLFGRAITILIVPIVLIQVVVGVAFVERLFQDVTSQMTTTMSLDVKLLMSELKDEDDTLVLTPEGQKAARILEIRVTPVPKNPPESQEDARRFFDVSGISVIDTFRETLPWVQQVDLVSERGGVVLTTKWQGKPVEFRFSRRRVSATNPHQLLVIMVFSALLVTMLSVVFLRNQIQPIRRLASAAEAFGKGQVLPLRPRGASEVRSATNAFLSMRARIERQIEQRTMMLSGVSHDLRTPLTRLKLSLSLMDPTDETDMMTRDLDEMEQILDEFLAFSRGDSGEDTELVKPKVLAKQLIKTHRRSGSDIELVILGNVQDDAPIPMRRMAIQRAVGNLIGNARKHGTHARLSLYLGAGFIEYQVDDDGPGIRKDLRETAMKPFSRLDEARNQDKGSGVGLGLAIAADVARSHGGGMTLGHSEDLGGLKVSFRLPR